MGTRFDQPVSDSLLAHAKAGRADAHAEIFRRFGGAVFTLARRLVQRSDVAEEILQDTFLDVMRQIGSYRGDAPFGFWLRRIAVNRALMFLRSYWEQHGEVLEDDWPEAGGDFDAALQRADLLSLLERLPATARAVLWLHEVEGFTHREIAAMTGRTPSFSKSQLARAHARLRALVMNETQAHEVPACMPTTAN